MIQMDMIGRNEEHPADRRLGWDRETSGGNANSINVIGSTFSPDLRRHIEEANRPLGLQLRFRYDDTGANLLQRSDQWPFLKQGIPALFLHTGEHPDYHRPTDTPDKINYPKLQRITRLVYLLAERIAGATERPRFVQP
jgi:Zn-dependent M28 family amino/carboxypeptidase